MSGQFERLGKWRKNAAQVSAEQIGKPSSRCTDRRRMIAVPEEMPQQNLSHHPVDGFGPYAAAAVGDARGEIHRSSINDCVLTMAQSSGNVWNAWTIRLESQISARTTLKALGANRLALG